MKILLLTQFLSGGGLERMVRLLGENLSRELGCKVFLMSFDGEDDPILRRELAAKGVTAIHHVKGRGFSMKLLGQVIKLIREEGIEVIHTHESAPLIYATLAKFASFRRVRIVHTQHSFIHLQNRSFIRHYDRIFQTAASHLTAVSEQVKDEYVRLGVKPNRVQLISNGVEFPKAFLDEKQKLAQRRNLINGLKTANQKSKSSLLSNSSVLSEAIDATWFISVARIHPKKGQDHLIRAWSELPASVRSESVLLLVGPETAPGEAARLAALKAQAPDSDRIVWVGGTSSPISWLQAGDVFLSGSEYEGMPLAPIEACGAGLPLVLSAIPGHQVLERYAHFFDFRKPAEAAAHLAVIFQELKNNRGSLKERCLSQAREIQASHSISAMARNYYGLYEGDSSTGGAVA